MLLSGELLETGSYSGASRAFRASVFSLQRVEIFRLLPRSSVYQI